MAGGRSYKPFLLEHVNKNKIEDMNEDVPNFICTTSNLNMMYTKEDLSKF